MIFYLGYLILNCDFFFKFWYHIETHNFQCITTFRQVNIFKFSFYNLSLMSQFLQLHCLLLQFYSLTPAHIFLITTPLLPTKIESIRIACSLHFSTIILHVLYPSYENLIIVIACSSAYPVKL